MLTAAESADVAAVAAIDDDYTNLKLSRARARARARSMEEGRKKMEGSLIKREGNAGKPILHVSSSHCSHYQVIILPIHWITFLPVVVLFL